MTSRKSRIVGFYTKRDIEFLSPERYLLPVRLKTGVMYSWIAFGHLMVIKGLVDTLSRDPSLYHTFWRTEQFATFP